MPKRLRLSFSWMTLQRCFFVLIVLWAVIGIICTLLYQLPKFLSLQTVVTKMNRFSTASKNASFYGPTYKAYTRLQKTPDNTKILYLFPDINHYARSVFFLYPRTIVPAVSPTQALAALKQQQFDYVLIYMRWSPNEGYISMFELQQYWNVDDLRKFVMEVKQLSSFSLDDLSQELNDSDGVLMYQFVEK